MKKSVAQHPRRPPEAPRPPKPEGIPAVSARPLLTLLVLAILLLVAAWQLLSRIDTRYYFSFDSGYYLCLGRSLARGGGYAFAGSPHTQYPPAYPLLTAAVQRFHGLDFQKLRLQQAAVALSALALAFLFGRRKLGLCGGIAVALAMAGNRDFVQAASYQLLSEPLYMLLSLAAILLAGKAYPKAASPAWTPLAALAALAAALTRSVGACSLWILALGFLTRGEGRSRWLRAAAFLLIFCAGTGAWTVRNHFAVTDNKASYLRVLQSEYKGGWKQGGEALARDARKVLEKAAYEVESAVSLTLNRPRWRLHPPLVQWVALALALGYLLRVWIDGKESGGGALRRFLANALGRPLTTDPAHLYFLLYFLIYCLWQYREGNRFLLPVLPMLLIYVGTLVWVLLKGLLFWAPKGQPFFKILAPAALVLLGLLSTALGRKGVAELPEAMAPFAATYDQARRACAQLPAAPQSQRVLFSMRPSLFALAGDLRAVGGFRLQSAADFEPLLRRAGCRYVEVGENDDATREYLYPLMAAQPGRFSSGAREGKIAIFRYDPEGQSKRPGAAAPNLLRNPGFEKAKGDSPIDWECESGRVTQGDKHGGRRSLLLQADPARKSVYAPCQTLRLPPRRAYLLSGWVRGDSVQGSVRVTVALKNPDQKDLALFRSLPLQGTFPWKRAEVAFLTSEHSELAVIEGAGSDAFTQGRLWLDDFELVELGR